MPTRKTIRLSGAGDVDGPSAHPTRVPFPELSATEPRRSIVQGDAVRHIRMFIRVIARAVEILQDRVSVRFAGHMIGRYSGHMLDVWPDGFGVVDSQTNRRMYRPGKAVEGSAGEAVGNQSRVLTFTARRVEFDEYT
jgi:hypothetical protein